MALQLQNGNGTACAVAERSMPRHPATIDRQVPEEIVALIPRLTRFGRSLTHDLVAADDLVQESLSRALEKIHLWRPGTDLRAWLFTIMHHQHVNEMRRVAREKNVPLGDRDQALEPHQGQHLEFRDLARAFDALPSEQRSAMMLVAVDQMQYDEAASLLNLPLGTVRSRVSRGRDTLRQLTDRPPRDDSVSRAKHRAMPANRTSCEVESWELLKRGSGPGGMAAPSAGGEGAGSGRECSRPRTKAVARHPKKGAG
jgi:RNA polymerase sigma-70 factor, ECF subfamily